MQNSGANLRALEAATAAVAAVVGVAQQQLQQQGLPVLRGLLSSNPGRF
jgi:hypothetical protein